MVGVGVRAVLSMCFCLVVLVDADQTLETLHTTTGNIGVAYSGGGITALLATMCSHRAIHGIVGVGGPDSRIVSDATISLQSLRNTTLSTMSSRTTTPSLPIWYGAILDILPKGSSKESLEDLAVSLVKKHGGRKYWWEDLLDFVSKDLYKLPVGRHNPGPHEFYANFGMLDASTCPTSRNSSTKSIPDASRVLYPGALELREGLFLSAGHPNVTLDEPMTNMDGISASAGFWAYLLLNNKLRYDTLHKAVESVEVHDDGEGKTVFLLDGGTVETTGIAQLLRNKLPKIVAFYNNNDDLVHMNSPFAFLFGNSSGIPNSMNTLEGPNLAHVFDGELYDQVMANLTSPTSGYVHLRNVAVRDAPFLGVEAYTLQDLVIFSNQRNTRFLAEFADQSIPQHLDKKFPNSFEVGMPTLDANTLCAFNAWKVWDQQDLLKALFANT